MASWKDPEDVGCGFLLVVFGLVMLSPLIAEAIKVILAAVR